MPRAFTMSWEGAPAFRWVKMYKGVRYRVTCEELGAMVYTKEGSAKLANEWWAKKLVELEGFPSRVETLHRVQSIDDELTREHFALHQKVGTRDELLQDIVAEAEYAAEGNRETFEQIIAKTPEMDRVAAMSILAPAVATDRTFKQNAERLLAIIQDEVKPLSYREIRDFIRSLYDVPLTGGGKLLHGGMDVGEINEAKVEQVFLWLKKADLTNQTRKKRWGFFRRLVRYFWASRLIELPRNLDMHSFKVQATAVKTFDLAEVRAVLQTLKSRLKLYALLGLNCGMTSVDIGQLQKDQVNLDTGRLTRKRVKTSDHENVPTVEYPLWPETLALLTEHWSDHSILALTSEDGTALWTARQEGDKTPVKDLVYQQFKRAGVRITIKHFRSISATLIEAHEHYGRYTSHFLGHSPKSIKDKHYAAPARDLFDKIIVWVRTQIFAVQSGGATS